MHIKETKKANGKISIRVMKSIRRGEKVTHHTVSSLGCCFENQLDFYRKNAKTLLHRLEKEEAGKMSILLPGMKEYCDRIEGVSKQPRSRNKRVKAKKRVSSHCKIILSSETKERCRVISGIQSVFGTIYNQLGFYNLIKGKSQKTKQYNELLKLCVLSRIAQPESKRKTVDTLGLDYNKEISLDQVYRMMDKLHTHIPELKKQVSDHTLSLFNQAVDVLFFDVTTLYFESLTKDDLKDFGFSKDCKFKEVQVVLALITNSEGHPLTYQLFPGNTSEGSTLIHVIQDLKKHFSVKRVILVADRAMFTDKNLSFMEKENIQYIVSAKLKQLSRDKKAEILSASKKGEDVSIFNEPQSVKELDHNGRRLLVSYSMTRAKKDKADRDRLIDRLMKKAIDDKISTKSLISNYGTKKYIKIEDSKATINRNKIKEDSHWDGLYGIITNIKDQSMQSLFTRYRGLWKIEEAFRVNKHTLRMRPIYHWKKRRIESHIAICFVAYALSYHIKHRLKTQNIDLSIQKIREILKRDQYSIIEDPKTQQLYQLAASSTKTLEAIYKVFELKRITGLTKITGNPQTLNT